MGREFPFFSIIVPTRNRPELLVACLHSMAMLEYPRDLFEIVVVVDGGTVPSGEQLASLHTMIDLTILTQSHAGPAVARNNGARHAKGEYFVFTDDDCVPMPDWLLKLAEGFLVYPDSVLGGRTINALLLNRYSAASHYLMEFLYTFYNPEPGKARFFASNNIALPAAVFQAIGGFSAKYPRAGGEDRDFCRQLQQHGYRLVYVPEAIIRHAHDLTIAGFFWQQFNYGRGSCIFNRSAGGRRENNKTSPSLSFYVKLMTYPMMLGRDEKKALLTLLFLLSQTAVATGRLWERLSGR